MKQLQISIIKTIYKLEIIFPISLFNLTEYMSIYLVYKVKVGELVQYTWMYLLKRLGITCIISDCHLYFCKYNVVIHMYLLSCKYMIKVKKGKKKKTKCMVRLILLKRFLYLPCIILSLIWEQWSTTFQDIMMMVNYLQVGICQYLIILGDHYQRMSWEKDIS